MNVVMAIKVRNGDSKGEEPLHLRGQFNENRSAGPRGQSRRSRGRSGEAPVLIKEHPQILMSAQWKELRQVEVNSKRALGATSSEDSGLFDCRTVGHEGSRCDPPISDERKRRMVHESTRSEVIRVDD